MGNYTLGEWIAAKRKEKRMTQADLGSVFCISDKAVSKWERNLSRPDEKFMPQLVALLGLPKEYLPQPVERQLEKSTARRGAKDGLRVFCTACMLAFSAGALTGLLPVESALPLTGASGGLFALATICRSKS
jgi:transcriptional regulator with XRE-family HTH domain